MFDEFVKNMLSNRLVEGWLYFESNGFGNKDLPIFNKCISCTESLITAPHSFPPQNCTLVYARKTRFEAYNKNMGKP